MGTFYGPDISKYQTVTDWNALNNGAAFIMIKSSGSDDGSYVDPKYEDNIAHARLFGNALPRIVYHFGGGANDGTDPSDEADYFVDNVGVNLQVGESYEIDCERGAAVTPDWALKFLNQAKARLGWGGGIYVSQSRLVSEDWSAVAAGNYFVHPADWAVSTASNFSVGAFKTYFFQQYTDAATWPGITAPCDGDAFFGPAAINILNFGKPAPITPPPAVVATPPPAPVVTPPPVVAPTPPEPDPTPTEPADPVEPTPPPAPTNGQAIDVVVKPSPKPLPPNPVPVQEPTVSSFEQDVSALEEFVNFWKGKKTYTVGILMILTSLEKYFTGHITISQFITTVQGIVGGNGFALITLRAAIAKIPKL